MNIWWSRVSDRQTSEGTISLAVSGRIATLSIAHPAKRNALTPAMLARLRDCLEDTRSRGIAVVVIRGKGRDFSSGFSLDHVPSPEDLPEVSDIEMTCDVIERLPAIVIAVIHGACIGAALDIACACDLRIARGDARLGIPAARLGLIYHWQGIGRIARVAGPETARSLLFTAELVRADSEPGRRLIGQVASDSRALQTELRRITTAVLSCNQAAIAGTKRVLYELDHASLPSTRLSAELHAMRQAALSTSGLAFPHSPCDPAD